MRTILISCVAAMLLVPSALAGEDKGDALAKAEQLAKDGQSVEAARLYGAELAAAQKSKDLERQERVVRSMGRAMASATRPGSGGRDVYARSLESVMLALDPKKNYAFCSAGQLGHALLLDATRTGDFAHVEAAARVCEQHAKIAKSGAFAGAMADYAAGLRAVAAEEPTKAIPSLGTALEVIAKHGWAWHTVHVATEFAAACVAAGQDGDAVSAFERAGDVMKVSDDRAISQRLRQLVTARLEGAPESVLAAYETAMKPFSGGGSVSGAGGRGGRGGSGGGPTLSKVGQAWKKLSKRKPFVTVTRTDEGYAIRQAFDKRFQATQPVKPGVKHHDDGGITLSFWDGGVRLYMVDKEGRAGQPGESSEPGAFLFFQPLAKGETWGVTKNGTVVVDARR